MASDYGDEAGSKMIDDFMRFGERMGEQAMYARAAQMQRAFQNATRSAQELTGDRTPEGDAPEWAKLDMQELQGIIKGIIEDRLAAHGVGSTWFPDPETGKEYLLFRIADAREVWQSFDELSRETDDAAAKAAEKIREQHEKEPSRGRDDRTLDERAEDAREASAALEAERSTTKALSKEPRFQEMRAK